MSASGSAHSLVRCDAIAGSSSHEAGDCGVPDIRVGASAAVTTASFFAFFTFLTAFCDDSKQNKARNYS